MDATLPAGHVGRRILGMESEYPGGATRAQVKEDVFLNFVLAQLRQPALGRHRLLSGRTMAVCFCRRLHGVCGVPIRGGWISNAVGHLAASKYLHEARSRPIAGP